MRLFTLFLLVMVTSLVSHAQRHIMVTGHADVVKTDMPSLFDKMQGSIEGHYFFRKNHSVNVGYEFRTDEKDFVTAGFRQYVLSFVFVRERILFNGDKLDISLAPGYKYFITRRWRVEAMPELYLDDLQLAIRVGMGYVFTK